MIKQDTRTISKLDGLLTFEQLRMVPNVNLTHPNQVTAAWLREYETQCRRQEEYALKHHPTNEAAAVRQRLREQLPYVQHLVKIILKSREV